MDFLFGLQPITTQKRNRTGRTPTENPNKLQLHSAIFELQASSPLYPGNSLILSVCLSLSLYKKMTKFRKLGRHAAHRMSMLRSWSFLSFLTTIRHFLPLWWKDFFFFPLRTMVSQLVKHERIETTVAKLMHEKIVFVFLLVSCLVDDRGWFLTLIDWMINRC